LPLRLLGRRRLNTTMLSESSTSSDGQSASVLSGTPEFPRFPSEGDSGLRVPEWIPASTSSLLNFPVSMKISLEGDAPVSPVGRDFAAPAQDIASPAFAIVFRIVNHAGRTSSARIAFNSSRPLAVARRKPSEISTSPSPARCLIVSLSSSAPFIIA